MNYRIFAAFAIGLLVTGVLAATASNSSSAKSPNLIGAFGKVTSPDGDRFVHVLAEVPGNGNAADVAAAAIAAQGARPITSAEFSLSGLSWTNAAAQDVDGSNGAPDIAIQYNSDNEPTSAARGEFADSLRLWSEVAPSRFSFVDNGDVNRCPSLVRECSGPQVSDGYNDFGWMRVNDRNTLAVTWFTSEEADVAMNTRHNWFVDNGTGFDILTVALHEMGHVTGLSHSEVSGAVMEAIYGGVRQTLTDDDIAGLLAIYDPSAPAPTPTPVPDATPTPTPDPGDPGATSVDVDNVSYSLPGKRGKDLVVEVAAVSGGVAASGATVSITLELISPTTASWTGTADTGSDGTVKFRLRNALSGDYRTVVETITLGALNCGNCPYVSAEFTKP